METVNKTNEYITFTLENEEYAIEVSGIESILEYTKVTKLPGTDEAVKGVINLRGKALPVIDLRTSLKVNESEITQNTSIIVMLTNTGDKIATIGGIVDSVKEVIEITEDMIQDAPKVGIRIESNYITGIAKHNDKFVIILDINKILSDDQLAIAEDENLMVDDDL
jgi:purine-binding chemotaxis protein CheW